MPIEDASVVWPEAESPYRTVARLTVPPQPAWSEARAWQVEDGLAFNPWNRLAAHRPLGSLNRIRREAYPEGARFRERHNGCPIREPRSRVALSDVRAQIYGSSPGREGRRPGTPDAPPGTWSAPMRPAARIFTGVALLAATAALALSAARLVMPRSRAEARKRLTREQVGAGGSRHSRASRR